MPHDMMADPAARHPLASRKSAGLTGRIAVPGDKSISHRSLMLGATAIGETVITGLLEAQDIIHSAQAMAAFGAHVERHRDGTWHVTGIGTGGYQDPVGPVDFGNSGTGVRLAAGLIATTPVAVTLTGDQSLQKRPMGRIIAPLEQMGARFEATGDGRLPMKVTGAGDAVPISYRLPVASAQVKSAVLLAGLNAPGITEVIEPVATRDHTERMLEAFGASLRVSERDGARRIAIEGHKELTATDIQVPGDPSSAAFAIVAALITDGSDVTVRDVMLNPTRTGLIDTLLEMGADIEIANRRVSGGEEIGDITARTSALKGVTVPAERAASMIDEYPVLSVAAAFASGRTRMEGLNELRVKESDRLAAIAAGLAANGVDHKTGPDWLEVTGGANTIGGGEVVTHMDHRIAMSFLVMGLAAHEPVAVDDASMIATSFPDFAGLMRGLGADIAEQDSWR